MSNWSSFRLIEKYDKTTAVKISAVFWTLNMLTLYKCSEMGHFRHLRNHAFCSLISERNHLWSSSFFSKWYIEVYFRNLKRNWENDLCFGENCIWIGCGKYSLLPGKNTCHRESISYQTVSRFQILLGKIFWNWSFFRLIKRYDKSTAVNIWAVFPTL